MTPVFADASYYIALLSPRDQHHQDAVRLSGQLRRAIVLTEFVLLEVGNALTPIESRGRAVALWAAQTGRCKIAISECFEVLHQTLLKSRTCRLGCARHVQKVRLKPDLHRQPKRLRKIAVNSPTNRNPLGRYLGITAPADNQW